MTFKELIEEIAVKIRAKDGTTGKISPWDYPTRIEAIPAGGGDADAIVQREITTYQNDSATVIGEHAFRECYELLSVRASKVTRVKKEAFKACYWLVDVTLPAVEAVEQYAFQDCMRMETIEIPACESVGSYAFSGCKKLGTVTFDTAVSIEKYAFQMCTALQKVEIAKLGYDSITANAFNGCTGLTAVILGSVDYQPAPPTSAFAGTPIANGGGYIYVPRRELDWMQYESEWTDNYDLRAIEDWPEITGG